MACEHRARTKEGTGTHREGANAATHGTSFYDIYSLCVNYWSYNCDNNYVITALLVEQVID